MAAEKLYRNIDGAWVRNPVGRCHSKIHRGFLTEKELKEHGCLKKKCSGFQKIECTFWEKREKNKASAKARKKELNDWYERTVKG